MFLNYLALRHKQMKKLYTKLSGYIRKNSKLILLPQGWFGITNDFSPSFETLEGTVGKIQLAINGFSAVSGLVAVAILVYAGYNFITSAGEADKIEQAQKQIVGAVIGLVIIFIARLIVLFVVEEVLF